ncbi:Phosphatidate phosphatase PAH2 [Linum perenne]
MYAVGRIGSYITKGVSTVSGPFHPFGGAVDIVVVEQADGSFKSSPWYVRFGKFQGVLKAKEKAVIINVNGVDAGFNMYLDQRGEAFFIRDKDDDEEGHDSGPCRPIFSDDMNRHAHNGWRQRHAHSLDFDHSCPDADYELASNEKYMLRARSGGPRIMGIVFGRRTIKADGYQQGVGHSRVSSLERAEMAADLLEVRWSTSISPTKQSDDHDNNTVDGKSHNDSCSNDERSNTSLSVLDTSESSLAKETSTSDAGTPTSSQHVFKEAFVDKVSVDERGQVVETFTQVVLEMPPNVDECRVQSADLEGNDEDIMSEGSSPDSTVLGSSKSLHTDPESSEVQSFTVGGASESSFATLKGSNEEAHETVCIASEGPGEATLKGSNEEAHETICIASEGPGEATLLAEAVQMVSEQLPEVIEICHGEMVNEETEETKLEEGCGKTSSDGCYEQQILSQSCSDSHNEFEPSTKSFDDPEQLARCCSTKNGSVPASECSEGEQFLFSDLDEPIVREIQFTAQSSSVEDKSVDGSFNANSECFPSVDQVIKENQVIDNGNLMANSTGASSPISISKVHSIDDVESARLVGSLPSAWSDIQNCDEMVHHPISHSLESKSKSHWKGSGNDELGCVNVETDKEGSVEEDSHCGEANPATGNLPQPPTAANGSWKFWPFSSSKKSQLKKMANPDNGNSDSQNASSDSKTDDGKAENASDVKLDNRSLQSAPDDKIDSKTENGKLENVSDHKIDSESSQKSSENEIDSERSQSATESKSVMGRSDSILDKETDIENLVETNVRKVKIRALNPTSEQLASLNLNEGANVVTFTFSTSMLGKQKVEARIFRWKWDDRIVISDVDGTITKSDVLGQFMPLVGMDWSHTGVTRLFSAIKDNGYKLLFLSARSISQAYHTRNFLFNLKQDGMALPEGPVVISPDGLFPSLYREVIRRAPHEFKIGCLEDIKALFPTELSPFYAGFGNRDTDELSYLKVGIPRGKIFIINPRGEVSVHRRVDTKSYTSLHDLVGEMFPDPVTTMEQEDYNTWNYWRLPPQT